MEKWKKAYKALRTVLLTVVFTVVGLYVAAYVLISLPPVQEKIKGIAEKELSIYLGTRIKIGRLSISPFNEVHLRRVEIPDPEGRSCLTVGELGAALNLWNFFSTGRLEFAFGEVIGLDAHVWQQAEGAPLNIQFLIDALKPKDKNKPPKKFDVSVKGLVIRTSSISFDRRWKPAAQAGKIDFNHLRVSNLRADISLPRIKNDDFLVQLHKLSFAERSGLTVTAISAWVAVTDKQLTVKDFQLALPGTLIRPTDFKISYDGFADLVPALKRSDIGLRLDHNKVTPADFSPFFPPLERLKDAWWLTVDGSHAGEDFMLKQLDLRRADGAVKILADGETRRFKSFSGKMELTVAEGLPAHYLETFVPISDQARKLLGACGAVKLDVDGSYADGEGSAKVNLASAAGEVKVSGDFGFEGKRPRFASGNFSASDLNLAIFDPRLGQATLSGTADLKFPKGSLPEGSATFDLERAVYAGRILHGISANAVKDGKDINAILTSKADDATLDAEAHIHIAGAESELHGNVNIAHLNLSALGLGESKQRTLSGSLTADLSGDRLDNALGEVRISDMDLTGFTKLPLRMKSMVMSSALSEDSVRRLKVESDFVDAEVKGHFLPSKIVPAVRHIVASVVPALMGDDMFAIDPQMTAEYSITFKKDAGISDYLGLPVMLLTDAPLNGAIDGRTQSADLSLDLPYLKQGRDKLIRNTSLKLTLDGLTRRANLNLGSTLPGKKGDITVGFAASAASDAIAADISWRFDREKAFHGEVSLLGALNRGAGGIGANLVVRPTDFYVNDGAWHIGQGRISYADKQIDVTGINVWRGDQYVRLEGRGSDLATDTLMLSLQDIDLGYIFDTLSIDNVAFGGIATGDISVSSLFSGAPVMLTDNLAVEDLAYNHAVLGDAKIRSMWNNAEKSVGIYADVRDSIGERRATVDGGIWVTRDSLAFKFDADKVNVGFLQPFMVAFCDGISGLASGQAHLFGTFHDIDMTGRLRADTIAMKLGFTNVTYSAKGDSVVIDPGEIHIPEVTLYDRYGHTAKLSGELHHNYFHDPSFRFMVNDARSLLVYDTNEKINPDWYGTIFGDGNGTIVGYPGTVNIAMNMTTAGNSTFTFVLNDTQTAEEYKFLTFTDRKRMLRELEEPDTVPEFVRELNKKTVAEETPSVYNIDLRATVTPAARLVLVMDPIGGDKIRARGSGALQMSYSSKSEELAMYGKYTLEEGNYNFTLQDIIIKDFQIRRGSSIAFNGDPFHAVLDIDAIYRVNTNLSDLDKSFSTDRDLNRTNVPVDAVLRVTGDMEAPDINFDIELPTLTQDVVRKVKSIISTDDMMSRQMIYLLALNRFYTPEYMSTSGNGGELASMASATLSSQLSSILGQLSDTWSFSPTFRSDKGDFSDTEVDLALSSRLLNNRLLLNGNFGYRDRSTSNTTFVGDFDIEYLLNRSGNLRLKAYNHYNDQNYYLKSALTTQGIGVIYRHDFDNIFKFLRRKKKEDKKEEKPKAQPAAAPADSVAPQKNENQDDLLIFK